MKTFCERYGPSFRSWWDSMGTPDLTPEVIDLLERGIREEEDGRDFDTLSAERDAKLIASMKALKGIQS